jgi:hypothetical protein
MSFEYIKHILTELEEILIMAGCIICLGLFIARLVRKKYAELFDSDTPEKGTK